MKVSKAQAQANRAHVVATASRLFRERGYDGVGVADLMGAAGFTHGGFYKQFRSKAALMAESAACGIAQTVEQSAQVDASEFVNLYVSRSHRDNPATGCTMAALGADAARQSEEVRAAFADGIERIVAGLAAHDTQAGDDEAAATRARQLDLMAHAVGAIMLSRACPDDSPLADDILAACRHAILAALPPSGA
ncbi:TetR/AcrR family transcriptional regulator [Xanthomonas campestris pv. zinniae]|uniref:TetR/AcrR family transcriptional regulator n=1 Tax=Xanthomonas cannabis TaxID=1885674 RepID=UPI001E4206DB|nr:TetR/AcrR family transcriptional regulator [Xanthomonas campestris pv. zinniae]